MTIQTANSTPGGNYTVTITGQSGGLTHTVSVTLTVQIPQSSDFVLSATPTWGIVSAGTSAIYLVLVIPTTGSSEMVNLSVSGLPAGATASFAPQSVYGLGISTLTIFTANSTPGGNYSITITGRSGGLAKTATVLLTVQAPLNL